jgi:hypothetical protein
MKGNRFERETCRELSLWYSKGTDGDIFWRSQSSGSRATKRGDQSLRHAAGDISAAKAIGKPLIDEFFVECKFYKDLQLANFLVNRASKLDSFWHVASRQASCYGLQPILIARQNRYPTLILMQPESWDGFEVGGKAWRLENHAVTIGLFAEFVRYARSSFVPSRVRFTS